MLNPEKLKEIKAGLLRSNTKLKLEEYLLAIQVHSGFNLDLDQDLEMMSKDHLAEAIAKYILEEFGGVVPYAILGNW